MNFSIRSDPINCMRISIHVHRNITIVYDFLLFTICLISLWYSCFVGNQYCSLIYSNQMESQVAINHQNPIDIVIVAIRFWFYWTGLMQLLNSLHLMYIVGDHCNTYFETIIVLLVCCLTIAQCTCNCNRQIFFYSYKLRLSY